MKSRFKKMLSLALTLVLAVSLFPVAAFGATVVDSGSYGGQITWTLDSDGVLTITGKGSMPDLGGASDFPWHGYRSDITAVVFGDDVTDIGRLAFCDCTGITSVVIPTGVTTIRLGTFLNCSGLLSITLPVGVTYIDQSAFSGCSSLKYVFYGGTADQWTVLRRLSSQVNNASLFAARKHYEATDHSWNAGEITTPATCFAMGQTTYTCSVEGCDATITRTDVATDPTNHVNTVDVPETASTCIAHGYTAGIFCSDCEQWISGHEEKPFADHAWNGGETVKAASCSDMGDTKYTCTVEGCGATETRTDVAIDSDNHVNTEEVAETDSTCYQAGYTAGVWCGDCETWVSGHEEKDLAEHSWQEVERENANCRDEGYVDYVCAVENCGKTKRDTLPVDPNAHHLAIRIHPATCTEQGYTSYTCVFCRYGYNTDEQPALGHRWSAPVWSWSGTSSASATFTCANGDHPQTVTATISSETVKEPTDTEAGKKVYTATVEFEGNTYTDTLEKSIPALNEGLCKWCGERHEGFFGRILGFFHSVAYFFAHLFGRR